MRTSPQRRKRVSRRRHTGLRTRSPAATTWKRVSDASFTRSRRSAAASILKQVRSIVSAGILFILSSAETQTRWYVLCGYQTSRSGRADVTPEIGRESAPCSLSLRIERQRGRAGAGTCALESRIQRASSDALRERASDREREMCVWCVRGRERASIGTSGMSCLIGPSGKRRRKKSRRPSSRAGRRAAPRWGCRTRGSGGTPCYTGRSRTRRWRTS